MPTDTINTSRILLAFLVICLLLFAILAFFFLYLCRSTSVVAAAASPAPQVLDEDATAGLDPSLVASFPTFTYSWVKNLHAGKCGLECVVCLSEFQDDDVLRPLAPCSHVFHIDCIDVWLMSHTTCPYCRHQLNPAQKRPSSQPEARIVVAEAADGQEAFEETSGGGEEEERRGEEGSFRRGW